MFLFSSSFQNIKKVNLRKRFEYRYLDKTWKIQIRIGNTDNRNHRISQIRSNTACGGILPAKKNHFIYTTYICAQPLTGRYLTAQEFDNIYMELSDVDVYTAGKCLFIKGALGHM